MWKSRGIFPIAPRNAIVVLLVFTNASYHRPLEPLPGFGPYLESLSGGTAIAEPPATLLNPFGEDVP